MRCYHQRSGHRFKKRRQKDKKGAKSAKVQRRSSHRGRKREGILSWKPEEDHLSKRRQCQVGSVLLIGQEVEVIVDLAKSSLYSDRIGVGRQKSDLTSRNKNTYGNKNQVEILQLLVKRKELSTSHERTPKTIILVTLGGVCWGHPCPQRQNCYYSSPWCMCLKSKPGEFGQIQLSCFINLGNFSFISLIRMALGGSVLLHLVNMVSSF